MRWRLLLILAFGILLSFAQPAAQTNSTTNTMANSAANTASSHTAKQMEFQDAMRKLWEDHIAWTRLFIVSAAADLPDKQATTERLLQNQTDIGNAIKPYYGNDAGDKLTALLKDHITIAAEVVTAAKANDKAKLDEASKRWYANADEIAAFLSGANKNWPADEMKKMMHEHLDLTTKEASTYLTKDWKGSIAKAPVR